MSKYKQLSQTQIELWLNDQVTKAYLQCLWWSRDQLKEALGNGAGIDLTSMEKTFAEIVIAEGKKQGYAGAMEVMEELGRHKMLEEGVAVEMPDIENILEE